MGLDQPCTPSTLNSLPTNEPHNLTAPPTHCTSLHTTTNYLTFSNPSCALTHPHIFVTLLFAFLLSCLLLLLVPTTPSLRSSSWCRSHNKLTRVSQELLDLGATKVNECRQRQYQPPQESQKACDGVYGYALHHYSTQASTESMRAPYEALVGGLLAMEPHRTAGKIFIVHHHGLSSKHFGIIIGSRVSMERRHTYAHAHTHTQAHTGMHTCTHTHTQVHAHAHMHSYTHTTYVRKYMHTCMPTPHWPTCSASLKVISVAAAIARTFCKGGNAGYACTYLTGPQTK